jgi:glycosyltransferase involved in cell wall biosynthesis
MIETDDFDIQGRRVLLIGPKVPPYGGMALQGRLMQKLMRSEGIEAEFLASNLPFPPALEFLDRIRGFRPFFRSVYFCWRLWKLLRNTEVVHILACSWLYFFVIVCPAVSIARLRRKRVILNYRGGQADDFFRWSAPVLKPFFRMADVVTAPSNFLVEVIERRIGVPVCVVPNIVNFSSFLYRERKPVRPKMIVTRHLLTLYDIESVVRAFAQVQRQYPEASLRIAGTGDQENHLRNLVAELKLTDVEFLGYVPQEELPALYDQCDILLNASLADNFPGSLVEAAASGLIVVSTKAGGIPFIFENGKSAILVNLRDWQGLAAGVQMVLQDSKFAARLSAEALQACRQYDWKNIRRGLYATYGFASAGAAGAGKKLGLAAGEALSGKIHSQGYTS